MSINRTSAFFSLSKAIAESFLQTAIVVDDRAYFDEPSSTEDQNENLAQEGMVKTRTGEDIKVQVPSEDERIISPSHLLNAKAVIDSFAQKGIVCSVLKPDQQDMDSLKATLTKLAINSDLIILDWDLHKDRGETALQIINDIVINNEAPDQLRLIVIYTGETDIGGVALKIKIRLENNEDLQVNEDSSNLSLSIRSIRIVIFAKPETEVLPEFKSRKITFSELADTVTDEFTEMTSGLVSNVVLDSLAQIRRNTYKILSNFSTNLDAPYLTHRVLQVDPEDAEDQLCTLITGELHAILQESHTTRNADLEAIKAWIETIFLVDSERYLPNDLALEVRTILSSSKKHAEKFEALRNVCTNYLSSNSSRQSKGFLKDLQELVDEQAKPQAKLDKIIGWFENNRIPPFIYLDGGTSNEFTKEQVINLLESGIENFSDFSTSQVNKSHKFTFTNMFLNHQEAHELDDKFAVITTLRSFYDRNERKLTLGTIIEQNDSYWVCVQPRCDTYRISGKRAFPFLPLSTQILGKNFDIVVKRDAQYLRMSISKKPYDLQLFSFEPNEKQVISTIGHEFVDDAGNIFKWVGELRVEQAQRLSNRFATELSRVGVNESQWLRRWSS